MKYSSFRGDSGDYDIFECAAERRGLADDMPPLAMKRSTPIGVASTLAGRLAPGKLTPLGRSKLPVGSILPLSRAGLTSLGDSGSSMPSTSSILAFLLGMLAMSLAYELSPGGLRSRMVVRRSK